jgi:pilus assembly protein Flp/PilA
MTGMWAAFDRFVADEDGATAIEYGLIAALIAVAAILAMTNFGGGLSGMFNKVENKSTTVLDGATV